MPDINLPNNLPPNKLTDPFAEILDGNPAAAGKLKEKQSVVVREVVSLIQNTLKVSHTNLAQTRESTGASGTTGAPVLDDPEDETAVLQDLEKLIAYLQLENDEQQAAMAEDRIRNQQDAMDKRHTERLDKIDESIEAAKKAAAASKASRVFGWLGAIFAVVAAVAITVATGGAAAAVAWAGAALAVTSLVLNETGASEKIVKAMAKSMQDTFGLSSQKAQAAAQGIYGGIFLVLGLATAGAGLASAASSAGQVTSTLMRCALYGTQVANTLNGIGGAISSGIGTGYNYDAANANADLSELNKFMALMQQMLEESQEELQDILEKLQGVFNNLIAMIDSKTQTGNAIIENMSQMV